MAEVRTSDREPIEIGWIDGGARRTGAIGLTFAPGKQDPSRGGRPRVRDVETDVLGLASVGTSMLVSLVEDHELDSLEIRDLLATARRYHIVVERFPIAEGGVPADLADVRLLVDVVLDHVAVDGIVMVHGRGGLGRAGTIGGCVLVAQGRSPEEAFSVLERARGPGCPENEAQRDFVRRFAASVRARPRPSSARVELGPDDPRSRFLGAVLGAAIGDAMGHPTEFVRSLDEIRARFGPKGVEGYARVIERHGARFAPYTDDTQMAEAVMRSLLSGLAAGEALEGVLRRMARAFVSWSLRPQGGHRGPGRACLAGCAELERGVPLREAGAPDAGGCGSVMRAYPFGLVLGDDLARAERWAVEHSLLTHGDPIALAACAAMAVAVETARAGREPEAVGAGMVDAAARYSAETATMIERALADAREGIPPEVTLTRLEGWAAHEAIAAAGYVFLRHADDARAAILEAANTIGDSDSIATLVGALVGARLGVDALPREWVVEIERAEALSDLALAAWEVRRRIAAGEAKLPPLP